MIEVPDFPHQPEKGEHSVTLESSFFLQGGHGIRAQKVVSRVGCRWGLVVIELVDVIKKDGEVVEVKVKNTPIEEAPKPKAFIECTDVRETVQA